MSQSEYRTSRRSRSAVSRRSIKVASELTPLTFARYSVANERHPERNEDFVTIDSCNGLAAVFDGVGGSAAGEIASHTAARAIQLGWKRTLKQVQKGHYAQGFLDDCDPAGMGEILRSLTLEADELVRTEGARRAGTDDLATTLALAALCRQHGQKHYTMIYAHVGDSRIYLLREQEPLKRLTSDDGLLARLVENQIVNDTDAHRIDQAMRT